MTKLTGWEQVGSEEAAEKDSIKIGFRVQEEVREC